MTSQKTKFSRRSFLFRSALAAGVSLLLPGYAFAKTYMNIEEAQQILWGDETMTPVSFELSKEQRKSIGKASNTRIPKHPLQVWKTQSGGWFIVEQIIGKHENIDMAFAINADGSFKDMEVLVYRESYGHEIMSASWRAQFKNKTHKKVLDLNKDIQNISGATLSCVHVMKGVNRLLHTWDQVLRHL